MKFFNRVRLLTFICVTVSFFCSACTMNANYVDGNYTVDTGVEITQEEYKAEQESLKLDGLKEIEDDFIAEVPATYKQNTLLRTTNDFKIESCNIRFETFIEGNYRIEENNQNIEFNESTVFTKKWNWRGKWNIPGTGGHQLNTKVYDYGSFWGIKVHRETKYVTKDSYKNIDVIDLPEPIFVDRKQELFIGNTDSRSNITDQICLSDLEGNIYWSFDIYKSLGTIRYNMVDDLLVLGQNDVGFYVIDYVNKEGIAKISYSDDSYNFVNGNAVYSDKYVWTIVDHDIDIDTASSLYRLNPNTLEVLTYDLSDPDDVVLIDNTLCVIDSKKTRLSLIDPDTGVVKISYDVNDYFPETKFTSVAVPIEHPFLCANAEDRFMFNPFSPDKSYEVDKYLHYLSNYKIDRDKWSGWDSYYVKDNQNDLLCGIDTFFNKLTWCIDISGFGANAEIEYVDTQSIIIAHGNNVTIYIAK